MNYYIKTIYGPYAYDCPAEDKMITFTNQKTSVRFKDCSGFLLYETAHKVDNKKGLKVIYAYGEIAKEQNQQESKKTAFSDGKSWSWGIKVNINKKVKTEYGIPISRLRELGIRQFQSQGGLIKITDEQFKILKEEL